MLKDYSQSFPGKAIFLPSITKAYAQFAHHGKFIRPMVIEPTDLNFLEPNSRLFHYPWALYSAGQAANTVANAARKDDIVATRNRALTTVLGDSGGFQIATDTKNKFKWEGDTTCQRLMTWMEDTSDYSMTLDFPTGAIATGVMRRHTNRLLQSGVDLNQLNSVNRFGLDYNACLYQSRQNNRYFATHSRSGRTVWLNVCQGRNEAESKHWYKTMREFPFRSWAFAGHSSTNLATTLRRIINMRDDGLLSTAKWMHFLGVGELGRGVLYTVMQKCILDTMSREVGFSYDASSPFQTAGRGSVYTGFVLDETKWVFAQSNLRADAVDSKAETLLDYCSDLSRWKFSNGIEGWGTRAVLGTNAFVGGSTIAGLLRLHGKENAVLHEGSLGTTGYMAIMNHNTHVIVDAHRMAQNIFFNSVPSQIPNSLKVAAEIIRLVFRDQNPYSLIDQCERELDFAWR